MALTPTPAILHYIFDPLCGWCYAAAPLVTAASAIPQLSLQLHAGGMLTGQNRKAITPAWRDYVIPHDQRIRELSGQPFGTAYFDGLLRDNSAVMDSEPPTIAILAAETLAQRGVEMLHRVQQAHYVEGQRVADQAVLWQLAGEIGLDVSTFTHHYQQLAGNAVQLHIKASRDLLGKVGGRGFPTFVLQINDRLRILDSSRFTGKPDAWREHLQAWLTTEIASTDQILNATAEKRS
ncbi:DsbA family protein [Cellvibrio polysaccharolyticus]|uniref:DsbA family protein n=1 Tax=Cellvibrio polysaccharolyticus TaxID=2082724 RepID=A0A928V8U1_9GAMM|nr:DsbA family protein [Cellvibrio polysaccharolyticus]MBE8719031.1 DsbA family protein [Cellvibrio polysaccharolyticus]